MVLLFEGLVQPRIQAQRTSRRTWRESLVARVPSDWFFDNRAGYPAWNRAARGAQRHQDCAIVRGGVAVTTTWAYVYDALGRLAGWMETTGGISTKYWAATDHLGSVTAATDSGGTLAMRRDFSAFGDSIDAVLETAAGPRYTGKDFDEDAELYYFNARWYDAELGRFTTEDPIKDGTNWYVYANDGPLAATDPSGLLSDHALVMAENKQYEYGYEATRESKENLRIENVQD